ncbi:MULTISPECIES: arginine--tRNA ligase [Paenibacillus]|uniref:arginine--tRNA ligase n=1 Tax=Paenibacillus TaxID=44249 RepID=UPI001F27E799|nr:MULTISPECIES: arginine--tRNA ligase [Paenibacillus]
MLSRIIGQEIEQSVMRAIREMGLEVSALPAVSIEQPASLDHGDYSSNIAMKLAKTLRMPPLHIANRIRDVMMASAAKQGLIRQAETAAPGFLNVRIDWSVWAGMNEASPAGDQGKVVIEHTSVNPNKAMHIGHLRNACIGDTLARLLRRTGHTVEVHNYIDDLGNQLADTVVGLLNIPLEGDYGRFGDYCWDLYSAVNRAYGSDSLLNAKRTETLHELEQGTGNTAWIGKIAAERIVRDHVKEMADFGILYDLLVWESSIVKEGFWDAAFERLRQTPLFVLETTGKLAGCWVLKQAENVSGDGDQGTGEVQQIGEYTQDKVLVRSSGILTYTAKDIAYHLWKFGLLDKDFTYEAFDGELYTTAAHGAAKPLGQAQTVINVIDSRQEYPQTMVKEALRVLGYGEQADRLHHAGYGVVSLSPASAAELGIDTSDGRASYAMSGRQGIGIKVSDLISRMERHLEDSGSGRDGLPARMIATAAIRYYLLRFNLGTEVIFDLRQAMELTGNTGVYLMYAHARAARVIHKAESLGLLTPGIDSRSADSTESSSQIEDSNSQTDSRTGHGESANGRAVPHPAPPFPAKLEPAELALLRQLGAWPDTLHTASQELTPNTICQYSHTLSSLFHQFYAFCPILTGPDETVAFRLWLTAKFKETLGDSLEVLGLPAPERL